MSTAAAWGPHGDGPGQCPAPGGSASVASWQAPPLDQGGGAGLRERINFLTGIALASPLSSPQQPVGQVWYRGLAHQKPDGRSPPLLIIAPAVPPATGGTNSATVCWAGRRLRANPRGARHRARGSSRRNLVSGGPLGARTMMQPCASAAKLRGGGSNLNSGFQANPLFGAPPPRIIHGSSPRGRR